MNTFIFAGIGLFVILAIALGVIVLLRRRSARSKVANPKKKKLNKEAKAKTPASAQKTEVKPAAPLPPAPPMAAPAKPSALPDPSASTLVKAPIATPSAPGASQAGESAGEQIRILVVDDNPDTRENVGRLLYFEDGMQVIGQAVNGRQGLEMAIKHKPHIVLMDINMPDMDGITATREMSVAAPFSQVIIMSVQAEQHYMKQAMAAGARDFQPKPFTAEELVNCIRRVYKIGQPIYRRLEAVAENQAQIASQPAQETSKTEGGPVIAVYSPKGGAGTSTIAANLAVALQQEYGDVVLMDADLQFGDILVHLNTKATRTVSDLVHDGLLDAELVPEIVLAHNSGLKLLLAPSQPELADSITAEMVSEIIKSLKKQFKLVVVDTGSHLNDKTIVTLDNADYVLLVTAPELPAIKSAKQFLELAEQIDLSPNRISVIINRATLPGGIPADKMEKALKVPKAYRIPDDPKMHLSINNGVALNQADAAAPSAQAITLIARDLWEKVNGRLVPEAA